MTGQELIDFILSNHLENYTIGIYREAGESPDWLGYSLNDYGTIDHEKKILIF